MKFLAAGKRRRLFGWLALGVAAVMALTGVAWLAKGPVRDAWLRHEAEAHSPEVRLAGGPAIVGSGNRG